MEGRDIDAVVFPMPPDSSSWPRPTSVRVGGSTNGARPMSLRSTPRATASMRGSIPTSPRTTPSWSASDLQRRGDTPCRARRGGRSSAGPPCPRGPSTRRGGAAVVTVPRMSSSAARTSGSRPGEQALRRAQNDAHDGQASPRPRRTRADVGRKRFGNRRHGFEYLHRATGVNASSPACSRSGRSTKPSSSSWWSTSRVRDSPEEDAQLAHRLRRAASPVLAVVNKVDAAEDEAEVPAFSRWVSATKMCVSSKHGQGSG